MNSFVGCKFFPRKRRSYGAIAQLARAPALQAGGPGFESPSLHQRNSPSYAMGFFFGAVCI
jgi:hypothetical protein